MTKPSSRFIVSHRDAVKDDPPGVFAVFETLVGDVEGCGAVLKDSRLTTVAKWVRQCTSTGSYPDITFKASKQTRWSLLKIEITPSTSAPRR